MKKLVFAWGRMNPPTIGHEKLVAKVRSVAKANNAEPGIYLSHTQNSKKDPLQYKDKIQFAKKAFGNLVKISQSKTIIELLKEFESLKFTDITLVAGSDRVNEFDSLLNKYNGKEYNFNSIKVVSAGERDPDAEGVTGMSASKLRQLAASGDINGFLAGVPSSLSQKDSSTMYNMLRKGMLMEKNNKQAQTNEIDFSEDELEKAVDEADWDELDQLSEEVEPIEERAALTLMQRIKRARQMKRMAPKLKRQRQLKKMRMAPTERLIARSKKLARNLMRKKLAGKKGEKYASLSASEKITIDRLIANKGPAIEKLAKRLFPKVKKAEMERLRQAREVKTESFNQYAQLVEKISTRQDSDISDRAGTQPARYHSGLSTSTKVARDIQFKKQSKMDSRDPEAYKPAPGDKTAKTKPSVWTKKFKDLFGEQNAVKRTKEIISREKQQDKVKHDRMLDRARLQDTRVKNQSTSEEVEISEKSMSALQSKAEKSGYSYGTLKKVYDRGVAAWRTGHRPGTTPEQWGYARVNAFIAKQKSGRKLDHDTDLAEDKGSFKHHLLQPSLKHSMQHAMIHVDKDNDGDVDNVEKMVPDELTAAEKNSKILQKRVVKKYDLEKKMAKKRIAFESAQLDESLQIERGAGLGTFMTAKDLGMKTLGGFQYHPSVQKVDEEHGAGEEGTSKLVKKYKKDTPQQ